MSSILTWCADLSITIPPADSFSSLSWPLLLSIASTLATRIFGLNGLVMYSSTPRLNPCNSSLSSLLAVSIITGKSEYCLISFSVSKPSILGIITSKSISFMSFCSINKDIASSPSAASTTLYPFTLKKSLTSFLILASSSTTNIFMISI